MSVFGRDLPRSAPLFRRAESSALGSHWLSLAIVALAIVIQSAAHLDCDVSWLITVTEKFLDGETPYVSMTDPNPPMSFLSLAPAVLAARALRLPPEFVVGAATFLAALTALGLAAKFFAAGAPRSRAENATLFNGALFLLLVAPVMVFAQREHLALIAMTPMLALLAARLEGARPSLSLCVLAGLGAGLAVCFKPPFAAPLVLALAAACWRERRLRPAASPESLAALAVCACYALATLMFFPAYLTVEAPVVVDVYARSREAAPTLVFGAIETLAPPALAALVGLSLLWRAAPCAIALLCAAASAGFLAAFFVQGKGWMNHAYPATALALFALLAFVAAPPRAKPQERRLIRNAAVGAVIFSPVLFGAMFFVTGLEEHPGLREALLRVSPPKPRVAAMALALDLGHPVVRQVGGDWANRQASLWITGAATKLLAATGDAATRARLEAYRSRDLTDFAQDVALRRPDVVLVENATLRRWMEKRSEVAQTLAPYRKAAEAGDVEIWTRLER